MRSPKNAPSAEWPAVLIFLTALPKLIMGGHAFILQWDFCARGLAHPEETYGAIERRLREVILSKGGSLSHHHGIGKVRREFILRAHSPAAAAALREAKKSLDPRDIFAASNGVFGCDEKSI